MERESHFVRCVVGDRAWVAEDGTSGSACLEHVLFHRADERPRMRVLLSQLALRCGGGDFFNSQPYFDTPPHLSRLCLLDLDLLADLKAPKRDYRADLQVVAEVFAASVETNLSVRWVTGQEGHDGS